LITDIAGRVKNVYLPLSKPLQPLFEAIDNSIDAIEDAQESEGHIEVEVVRDENTLFSETTSSGDRQLAEITGFVVKDNGIGFDDNNYDEFNKSDTTYKAGRGGKGIGRFTWLAAFDKAEIESIYSTDGLSKRRTFVFSPKNSGIGGLVNQETNETRRGTIVRLIGYKEKYRKQCPKRFDTIAAYIVEEFLDVFIGPSCPKIVLIDGAIGQHVDLDEFYQAGMVRHSEQRQLTVKGQPFNVLHVRLYSTHIAEHRIYYCAKGRVVTRERMTGIPNLIPRFQDQDSKDFVCAAYVSSGVLDGSVNSDRTGFNLIADDGDSFPQEVTLGDVRKAIREQCKSYLSPLTEPVRQEKQARIKRYIEGDGAMYRPILSRVEKSFDKIEPTASDDEIEQGLYEAYHELQSELRKEGANLLTAVPRDTDLAKYEEQLGNYFAKLSEVNRSDLARYVCHRKATIEFLRQQLARGADGKYRAEDRIHNIVFPKGRTSDEVLFEEHNLWLVDERLAFHVFLSSDKAIKQAGPLTNESGREPDIMVFDKVVAFSETGNVPFNSITIIEFKKPQRDEYTEKENPFTQIANYVREIRQGSARLTDGRAFPISSNVPFYCYVICDVTTRLSRWAEDFELQTTPDGLGFFGYKRNLGAYCEVISYSKLVSDAEKRHAAFFERLGLPRNSSRI